MFYKINTQFQKYATIDSVSTLIEDLERNKHDITTLDLSMNTYTPEVMKAICKIIKEMENLKNIRIESIFDSLTFEEMSSVLSTLSVSLSRNLRSFESPSNAISCNFPEEFGNFLSECSLNVLDLYNCGLGQEGLLKIIRCLDKLENKSNLQVLNLSKNRINVIDKIVGPVISKFENISDLRIKNNTIEEKSLGEFLRNINNDKLEIMDLSDNFVCGEAIEELGKLFVRGSIKQLYLQDTKMDDGDMVKLLRAFNTKQIQTFPGGIDFDKPSLILDISCNDFEQDGIEMLETLASKFSFTKLIIFENSYEDAEKLKEMVVKDGGIVIDEEEDEEQLEIDEDLIQK